MRLRHQADRLPYSLNNLYAVLGTTKQAVSQLFKRRLRRDEQLIHLQLRVDAWREVHPGCGLEKLYHALQPDFIGRDRFITVFMEMGYRVFYPKNYVRTTFSIRCPYKNLISGAVLTGINQLVQTDITYFIIDGKHYYGVFIIDAYSKRIVGHQVSDHMYATANLAALQQFCKLRGREKLHHCVHHSDHGAQYASGSYTGTLNDLGFLISMSDSAQDNAYAERINGTIKNEYVYLWDIKTLAQLIKAVERAVRHYNFERPHNYLPKRMPPVVFEETLALQQLEKETHLELVFDKNNFHKRPHAKSLGEFDKVPLSADRMKLVCPIQSV